MSLRYPGGLITKTPTVPTTTAAPGIWTMEQALEYIKAGTWPTSSDPYFNLVTLLLHGNGTNGAQNNTFLDSSTNNFSITRNGDTTQGTFSPFSRADGSWSNYFASSSINAASNAAFAVGTGNFTLEAWIYPLNWTGDGTYSIVYSNPAGGGLMLGRNGANFVVRAYSVGDILQYGTLPTLNTWTHVVAVRSGTTISMYYNGTRVATTTSSNNFVQAAAYVGKDGPAGGAVYAGYVSNLRLVNGTAVYDPTQTTLTVPTTPLTAVANTSLLVCQNNRFKDNSTNNFSLSIEGSPSVQVFNPFNPTTAYLAATNGGSGYFDGSGDYLSVPANSWNFGSNNFTIEAWCYFSSVASAPQIIGAHNNGSNASWLLLVNSNATVSFAYNNAISFTTSGTIPLNSWNHIAAVRDSSTLRLYINGVQSGSSAISTSIISDSNAITIGADNDASANNTTGYYSGVRVLNGTTLYPNGTTFTPPTSPPTNIANTSLLLNFTNGGIFDNAAMNDLQTVGNAQISTAQSKFGGGSMAFDGTGDGLLSPLLLNWTFGSGNFTMECWLYTSDTGQYASILSADASSAGWSFLINSATNDGKIVFYDAVLAPSLLITSTGGYNDGAWHHIALVRNGTSLVIYVDGTSRASSTLSAGAISSTPGTLYIGASSVGGGARDLVGYIDDLRITKGYARYTANFTAPTAPFPNL